MASSKVIDRDMGYKALEANFRRLAGKAGVLIGIRSDEGEQEAGEDINLAGLAAVHEFGTDRAGAGNSTVIPERSFLRSTADANKRDYATRLGKALGKAITDKSPAGLKVAFGQVGAKAAGDVKRNIRSGLSPKLAESTEERKGSTTPLIDTGRLINSIDFEVEGL